MHDDIEGAEYLAPTQLNTDPRSFVQVVKEVFLHEHGCLTNMQIAEVKGVHKSRISQMFKQPTKLQAESIKDLLDVVRGAENKRRIVEAWIRECFGPDITARHKPFVGKQVTERTIRNIDKQVRQGRLIQAERTASAAFQRTTDEVIREQLLDRVFFARQRLDEPGQAMSAARIIVERATKRRDILRLAGGHLFRGRVLLGLADSRPEEVFPILDLVGSLLAAHPAPSEKPPYFIADQRALDGIQMGATLTFVERKMLTVSEAELRRMLKQTTTWAKQGHSYQAKCHAQMFAARIHILLGETVAASEVIEAAFSQGKLKNLNILEMCGLLQAKVMAVKESPEDRSTYLRGVIRQCARSLDVYHRRLAEYDLARTENERLSRPS